MQQCGRVLVIAALAVFFVGCSKDTAKQPLPTDAVTPSDGHDTLEIAEAITNTPPSAPVLVIEPSAPGIEDDVTCTIEDPSTDPDRDQTIDYLYFWERNGQSTDHTGDTIPADATSLWDDWTCHVVPTDGIDKGTEATASAHIVPGAAYDQRFSDTLDDIQEKMDAKGVPGAAVAIVLEGRLAYSSGLGVRELGKEEPVTAQDLFCVQSISKPITAAAAMVLVEEGKLDLDLPVTAYIPFFVAQPPNDVPTMTVRHVLSHTSGYPNTFGSSNPASLNYSDPNALKDFHKYFNPTTLWSPPGAVWNYSNLGYGLAGLILEGAGGAYYAEILQDKLFDPVGMDSTSGWDADAPATYALGHSMALSPGTLQAVPMYAFDNVPLAPYARVMASADDLARFAEMLMRPNDDVLTAASKAAMMSPQRATNRSPDEHFGMGFFVWEESRYGVEVVSHGGSGLGYVANFLMIPDAGFAAVVLANHDQFYDVSSLNVAAMKRFLDLPDIPKVDYKTDPTTWTKYTGSYVNPGVLGGLTVWMTGDAMGMSFESLQKTVTMVQMAGNHFMFKGPAGHPTLAGKWVGVSFAVNDEGIAQYIVTPYGVATRLSTP